MAYPSIWLAGLYDGKKYYGQSISAIKKEIKAVIKDVMRRIASEHNLSQGNMGANRVKLQFAFCTVSFIHDS